MVEPVKINVQHANFFYGSNQALYDVSMQIRPQFVTALIGPSGCGKSTFLRSLNRMNDLIPGARLEGKVVGLVTVQEGTSGTGHNTLTTMLLAARAMRAWVAPTMLSIPASRTAFDPEGQPINAVYTQRLQALGREVAKASAMFAAHWH